MGQHDLTATGRPTKVSINRAIQAHMDEQCGLVGYRQLTALGLKPDAVARRVAAGELMLRTSWPPRRPGKPRAQPKGSAKPLPRKQLGGAYAGNSAPLAIDAVRWAAILAAPPQSWIGGASACALLDLERQRGTRLQILHLGGGWRPPLGVTARRTGQLADDDRFAVRGIPCTGFARSVIDGATEKKVTAEQIDAWLDRGIEIRLYDEVALRRVIKARESIRGAARLDAALERIDVRSGEFRSLFEQKTTRLVQTSTLIPAPVVNVLLHGFRPDLLFLGTRAIVECDGRDYHRSLAQIIADERREQILRARGFVFLRLRWADVQYHPEATLARIERFVLENTAPPVHVMG